MNVIQRLEEEINSSNVVRDSVSYIFEQFEQRLDDIELEKQEAPLATELAMAKLHKLIDLATMPYDGKASAEEIFEKMMPDGEPYPDKIDSWARGIVTTRKIVAEEINFNKGPLSARSGTPSVSSYRSSVTGKTRSSSAGKSSRSYGSRGSDREGKSLDKTGQIIELDDPDNEFGDFHATGQMFDMLQRAKRKKEKGNFGEINADGEDVKGEFDILQEQMAKAAKDLRGKKFILDRYGQPIILGSVDPKRLPALSAAPNLQVKEVYAGQLGDLSNRSQQSRGGMAHRGMLSPRSQQIADEQQAIAQMRHNHGQAPPTGGGGGGGGGDGQKKRQFVRVAGSRGVDEASFMPTLSLATTLSGVDQVPKVNPGVTVKSKTSSKAGQSISEDPKHISRKALLAKTAAQQQQQQQMQLGGGLSQSSVVSGSNSMMFSPGNRSQQGLTVGFQDSSYIGGGGAGGDNNNNNMQDVQASIDSLPDFNRLEGSRKIVRVDETRDWTDAELGIGPYDPPSQTSSQLLAAQQHQQQNRNHPAGHSPDSRMSGSAAGKLPQKPSDQQEHNIRLLRGSPDKGKPKDRDQPKNVHPVAQRKHLPAPPLGQTTGHGLSLDKFHEKNSLHGGDSMTQGDQSNWTEQWRN